MELFGYPIEDYELPANMDGWHCLDLGSHSGTVAYQMLQRGASVRCFDPGQRQTEECRVNLRGFGGRVEINQAAVWRSGEYSPVQYDFCEKCPGASIAFASPEWTPIKTVGLDALILDAIHDGHKIDMAKIDVEGAEYPILYTSELLQHIPLITMEVHDFVAMGVPKDVFFGGISVERCTMESMQLFLVHNGYKVECNYNGCDSLFMVVAKK